MATSFPGIWSVRQWAATLDCVYDCNACGAKAGEDDLLVAALEVMTRSDFRPGLRERRSEEARPGDGRAPAADPFGVSCRPGVCGRAKKPRNLR